MVLPLTNLSGDQESEYLSDGLTDELIGALARMGGLRVISRTSAFAFKGKNVPLREIGEQLKVAFALEGGVRRAGDRLRISAQLVRVSDDSPVWSETYERRMADMFEVQDDIARRITSTLSRTLKLTPTPTPVPPLPRETSRPTTSTCWADITGTGARSRGWRRRDGCSSRRSRRTRSSLRHTPAWPTPPHSWFPAGWRRPSCTRRRWSPPSERWRWIRCWPKGTPRSGT